jgi:CBS domain containing-hemolysin-like protein
MIISLVIALVLAISMSAILASSETSFFSLSQMQIKNFIEQSDPKKRLVGELISKPRDLLVTILIVNIAMNIFVQNIVASLFESSERWWMNVLIPLVLTLVFGEVLPKSIALSNNVKIAVLVAPFLAWIQWMIGPLRTGLTAFTQTLSRFFFFFLKKEPEISIDELKHALKTSSEFGILGKEEAKLIHGYLSLEEFIIKEIMTPRVSMLTYSLQEPLTRLKEVMVDIGCHRVPVYDQDREHILGILKAESVFLNSEHIKTPKDLLPLLKKPFFIPETLSAKQLFNQFNSMHKTMAIVVDEYGTVSGIVTKEDLVEVMIGHIESQKTALFTKAAQDVLITSGSLELTEFQEIFGVELESDSNMATVGGWLIEQLSEIPKSGTKYSTDHFFFHVLAATPRKIKTLYIRKLHTKRDK